MRARRWGASYSTTVRGSAATAPSRSVRPEPLRGRNPSNTKRPAGSPLVTSAANAADGPGTTSTGWPAATAAAHQPLAGVGDAGHAGVGHDRHPLAPAQAGQDPGTSRASVWSFTTTRRGRSTPGVLEEPSGAAGVLAADGVGRAQGLGRPGRQVAQVPDGRAHEHEHAVGPAPFLTP